MPSLPEPADPGPATGVRLSLTYSVPPGATGDSVTRHLARVLQFANEFGHGQGQGSDPESDLALVLVGAHVVTLADSEPKPVPSLPEPSLFMVFDVESVGLHGEGFAFGFVVVDRQGNRLDEGLFACHPEMAKGDDDGRKWVAENVAIDADDDGCVACTDPRDLRSEFLGYWGNWKRKGAVLVADCCWPVEARFLAACIDDHPASRYWEGPYPLHDLASIRLAAGLDPLGTNDRLPDELPAHDPLADARQSARLLIEALDLIASRTPGAITHAPLA